MRSFLSLLVFLIAALVAAAALAYPAWWLVGLISDQPIHRVMHRIAMLVAFIGLIWIFRAGSGEQRGTGLWLAASASSCASCSLDSFAARRSCCR